MTKSLNTPIAGLCNFRDTGGMPLREGGSTAVGVLFRSEALSALTQQGLDQLAATDIGVIVDFRTPAEREAAPDRLPSSRPFRTVQLSILEGAVADMAKQFLTEGAPPSEEDLARAMASVPTLGDLYLGMLQHAASAFAEVARLVAASSDDAPTAVLVHCTAGKDRTGVATALLLDAAGAERAAIVADYASSQQNLAEGAWAGAMLQDIAAAGLPMSPELITLATGTPPEAIETAFEWIDTTHGGAAGYLASGGLTTAELAALRRRLRG